MLEIDHRYFITTEESGTVDLSGDTGAMKVLYEPWEDVWHGFRNGEPYQQHVEREAGVYLPQKRVNGGTIVQNDPEALAELVELATDVARRADDHGWSVYGAGKNHDNTMQVFADTSSIDAESPKHFKGDPFLGSGPFRGCTIMGIPLKWWDHFEEQPAMKSPDLEPTNG